MPNLESLLCKSKFITVEEERIEFAAHICKKPLLIIFKSVNKVFLLKNNFNCESMNLIYVVICQVC